MTAVILHVTLIRHGATEWSELGRHTSVTDMPLSELGVEQAKAIRSIVGQTHFDLVLSSPMARARTTAALAGLGEHVETNDNLHEWRYGDYEGLTTAEIRERENNEWTIWTHPTPGGETPEQVGRRADAAINRLPTTGKVALVSHGHFLRVLTARWLGMPPESGKHFELDTASVCALGFERDVRTIEKWNLT